MKNYVKYTFLFLCTMTICFSCKNISKKRQLIKEAERQAALKNYKNAILLYDEIIQIDPNDEGPFVMKGHIYNSLREIRKAETSFQKAIEMNSSNSWAYAGLSNSKRTEEDFEAALVLINKAIILNPNVETLIRSKSNILKKLEKFDEAIEMLKAFLAINKNSLMAINELTSCYLAKEEYNQVYLYGKQAIELAPNDCAAIRNYAHFYYRINKMALACEYATKGQKKCKDLNSLTLIEQIKRKACL